MDTGAPDSIPVHVRAEYMLRVFPAVGCSGYTVWRSKVEHRVSRHPLALLCFAVAQVEVAIKAIAVDNQNPAPIGERE